MLEQLATGMPMQCREGLTPKQMYLVYISVFLYTLLAGLAIQKIFLPFVFPGLDGGHGLLKGGDSVGFQAMASALAKQISLNGWSVWELRPHEHAPVGIASAVYAITGIYEPWVVLPINAALYALAVLLVVSMAYSLTNNLFAAAAAALPFLVFPSAATLYADLHKDVWSLAGSMLVVFALVRIAGSDEVHWRNVAVQGLICLVGALLLWVVRPYFVKVVLFAFAGAATLIVIAEFFGRPSKVAKNGATKFFSVLSCLVALASVAKLPATGSALIDAPAPVRAGNSAAPAAPTPREWSQWTPSLHTSVSSPLITFENVLKSVSYARVGFLTSYSGTGSMIDTTTEFHSSMDVVRYVPRALQIGLFAPFPTMWFTSGVNPGAGIMRAITGIEMAACYFLLPGLILVLPLLSNNARRTELVVFVFCVSIIAVLGLAVPNVGTLYRLRFPFFMLPVAFGAGAWVVIVGYLWSKRRRYSSA